MSDLEMRMAALDRAIEACGGMGTPDYVLDIAQKYYEWIKKGLDQ